MRRFFLNILQLNLPVIIIFMNLKTKKIEKKIKKTRNFIQKMGQYETNQLRMFVAPKSQPKERKLKIARSGLKNAENQQSHMTQSEKIVVDLNLGQYGFDSMTTQNSIAEIEELLKNCQSFSLNPNMQKMQWKQMCGEMTSTFQKQNFLLRHQNNHFFYSLQQKMLVEINSEEYVLWQCMHQLFTKIKNGTISPGLVGAVTSQSQSLRRFLKKSQICLQGFYQIQKRKEIERLTQRLYFEVAFKTFLEGLKVQPIDMLNYFLIKQFQENSRMGRMENEIKNWEEWAQFIQKKRVRLRKANKFLLHTACQLCLSPYSQQSNPMSNCPQCHIRGHKLCLGGQKNMRCGRCIYLRLSNQMKSKIPECFICSTKSLAPIKINSSKFAHVFCLMASQLWTIAGSTVEYSSRQEEKVQNKIEVCKICKMEATYFGRCRKCNTPSHFICAYMEGCQFEIGGPYRVNFSCCELDNKERVKAGEQRKYILNYNNVVFKKLGAIQISGKKRRKPRNDISIEDSERSNRVPSGQQSHSSQLQFIQQHEISVPEMEEDDRY